MSPRTDTTDDGTNPSRLVWVLFKRDQEERRATLELDRRVSVFRRLALFIRNSFFNT